MTRLQNPLRIHTESTVQNLPAAQLRPVGPHAHSPCSRFCLVGSWTKATSVAHPPAVHDHPRPHPSVELQTTDYRALGASMRLRLRHRISHFFRRSSLQSCPRPLSSGAQKAWGGSGAPPPEEQQGHTTTAPCRCHCRSREGSLRWSRGRCYTVLEAGGLGRRVFWRDLLVPNGI
jgi:hypothetical protein